MRKGAQAVFLTITLVGLFALGCNREKNTLESIPNPKQTNGGYVSNPDKIISDFTVTQLNEQLSALDNEEKAQVAVVVLNSIGNKVPKDFAVSLFNYWKIGSEKSDNGLLVLVIKDQHRVEFETGYGIESDLPDIICLRIEQDYMVQSFKSGDYDKGLTAGVNAVVNYLYTQRYFFNEGLDASTLKSPYIKQKQSHAKALSGWVVALIFFILYIIITFIVTFGDSQAEKKEGDTYFRLFRNKLYSNYRLELAFLLVVPISLMSVYYIIYKDVPLYLPLVTGYLTWCFFVHLHYLVLLPIKAIILTKSDRYVRYKSLAEAYRNLKGFVYVFPLPFLWSFLRWHVWRMKKMREVPYTCECGKQMKKLNEKEDNEFLSSEQIVEEELNSIDYDVWQCPSCHHHLVLEFENYQSSALSCESCQRKTVVLTEREVIQRATKHRSGYGFNHFKCENCGSEHKVKFVLLRESSSHSGSSSGGGSNWGGGSSGGGGAGSSW